MNGKLQTGVGLVRMATAWLMALAVCWGLAAPFAVLAQAAAPAPAPAGSASAFTQPPREPQLRIQAGMHTGAIWNVSVDAAGQWAATASHDKTALVWELATGKLQRVLRVPAGAGDEGKLNAVAMAPNGQWLAVAGSTGAAWGEAGTVYVLERATGRMLKRLQGLKAEVSRLAISPNGQFMAVAFVEGGVQLWALEPAKIVGGDEAYDGAGLGLAWAGNTHLVSCSDDGVIRLYQLTQDSGQWQFKQIAQRKASVGKEPHSVAVSMPTVAAAQPNAGAAGPLLAVGFSDGAYPEVYALPELRLLSVLTGPPAKGGNVHAVAWSADGQVLAAGGTLSHEGKSVLRLWRPLEKTSPLRDVPTVADSVMDLATLPAGQLLLAAADPALGLVDTNQVAPWKPLAQAPIADLRGSRGHSAFLVAEGAEQLQFGFEESGDAAHSFDLLARELKPGILIRAEPAKTRGLPIANWVNSVAPTLAGQPIALNDYEVSRSVAIAPDDSAFVMGTSRSLRAYSAAGQLLWERAAPASAWGVNIVQEGAQAGKLLVAAYGDGTLRWHRMKDGAELLALFPHADRKRWVLFTPSGYFDASPGGDNLIGWHVNRSAEEVADFYAVSQLRGTYFRPDVVDAVLKHLDEGQALKTADAARASAGGTQARGTYVGPVQTRLPPVLELVSAPELITRSAQITLRVRARTPEDSPVQNWRVRVNGAIAPGAVVQAPPSAVPGATERLIILDVPQQASDVHVFAQNQHGSSEAANVRVMWEGAGRTAPDATSADGFQVQPKLFVLAIGVGKYQSSQIPKLELPAKDARDFAAVLQGQKGKLYRDVRVKLLTEGQATADAVVDGLEWLQREVTQHDVGVVFLSGHGVNDPAQGYSFLPVNADPTRLRRTAIAFDEFKKTMSNLPGKAMFFFDTCHSGNALGQSSMLARSTGQQDVSGVINELASAQNGIIVFSSSTGRQLSFEDAAWGNGAFTKAVIEGLKGGADYQKTGRITHKMLDLYVSERVKQLTRGRQSPVTQTPGGVPDFPIAVLK